MGGFEAVGDNGQASGVADIDEVSACVGTAGQIARGEGAGTNDGGAINGERRARVERRACTTLLGHGTVGGVPDFRSCQRTA